MTDISNFEVQQWLRSVIDQIAYDIYEATDEQPSLPPMTLETWRSIGSFKQELGFCFLLGAIRRLMMPPDGMVGAEPIEPQIGEGPGERLSPPDPSSSYSSSGQ